LPAATALAFSFYVVRMAMMLDLPRLQDFAKRYTAAWCSRNASSVAAFFAAFFAPNGLLSVNGTPAVGRRAITEVVQSFMTAFPDMELFMDDILMRGDRAVYHWTFVGTNTGPGGTGHGVRFSGFEEWKFGENGIIVDSLGHFDDAAYRRQLEQGLDGARS
jgi:predicted ester cyclase